ncbi:MAG TPA: hypothetical protein DCM73_08260 [Clostridiales bacterium]|nr:hypothetical protein [Clostridiales bacterium]
MSIKDVVMLNSDISTPLDLAPIADANGDKYYPVFQEDYTLRSDELGLPEEDKPVLLNSALVNNALLFQNSVSFSTKRNYAFSHDSFFVIYAGAGTPVSIHKYSLINFELVAHINLTTTSINCQNLLLYNGKLYVFSYDKTIGYIVNADNLSTEKEFTINLNTGENVSGAYITSKGIYIVTQNRLLRFNFEMEIENERSISGISTNGIAVYENYVIAASGSYIEILDPINFERIRNRYLTTSAKIESFCDKYFVATSTTHIYIFPSSGWDLGNVGFVYSETTSVRYAGGYIRNDGFFIARYNANYLIGLRDKNNRFMTVAGTIQGSVRIPNDIPNDDNDWSKIIVEEDSGTRRVFRINGTTIAPSEEDNFRYSPFYIDDKYIYYLSSNYNIIFRDKRKFIVNGYQKEEAEL